MMIFYEGAVSFETLKNISIPDLMGLLTEAEEITRLREKEMDKSRVK